MTVSCNEQTFELGDEPIHCYRWAHSTAAPCRTVVLIHGMMMHGGSFTRLASQLALERCLVVAPDLRGFGRSYFKESKHERSRIDYRRSVKELEFLVTKLKEEDHDRPLFCAGESLGAHLARHLAAAHPRQVAGLILSNPCISPRISPAPLIPFALTQLMISSIDWEAELNLSPFVELSLKDEPENLASYLNDPMTRKSLEIIELIDSIRIGGAVRSDGLPADMPVLILRGKRDCVCKDSSTSKFLEKLQTNNMTLHQCSTCGHLLLQNAYVDRSILRTMVNWLERMSKSREASGSQAMAE